HQIEVDGEPVARAESGESVLVPWPSAPLGSRQRVTWRVKVWTDEGESDWSAPCTFETGLLEPGDWTARWIEPDEQDGPPEGSRPAYVFRHEFTLDEVGEAPRLYATAHGIYETFLNGHRVGDVELAPGYTSYHANLHFQTYDVGGLLRPGDNLWEVVLSDGWWRGRTGYMQEQDCFGDSVACLGQLHAGDRVVTTGEGWTFATGPIQAADLMAGQAVDLRVEPDGWRPVRLAHHDLGRLTA